MKKVVSLILMVAILIGVNPVFIAYAQEGIDVSGYKYIVNQMEFYDADYDYSETPVTGGEVGITVTKRAEYEGDASLIVSTYTAQGKMLGLYDAELELLLGEDMTAYFELSAPEGYEVAKVRAYVWESFDSPVSLSNVCSEDNPNEIEDPCVEEIEIEIPSVNTDFSDIPPESDYALAVKTVADLGILNGYEDGNFYPDSTVTRAEAAHLIVKLAGRQKAAQFLKNEEYFDDVPADHWAAAAINYCYAKGYLVTDGTSFEPEKMVSAKEFIKMLLDVMGYTLLAELEGGYPVGYVCVADDMGLLDGLNIDNYTTLKRSEIAVLIANAINKPIAEKSYIGYENGEISYSIIIMDGVGGYTYYKSLLTEVFSAYLVEGTIIGNYKTAYVNEDEIEFEIVDTENYEDDDFANNYPLVTICANIGETDFSLYEIGSYLRVIIRVDENDNYVILSAVDMSASRNKVYEFDCSLLDTADYEDANGEFISGAFAESSDNFIMVYESETASKSTKYVLQRSNYDYSELDVDLYVNGVLIEGTRENIENYVLRCETGNIKLVDTYKTDGYYDTIHVNYYVTGKVMGVIASTGKIYIENAPSSIILDPENEDLVYSIYLDGEEITVDDLREGDVLTIAYDISGYFVDSFFYEIYVSRDTVSGVLTEKNPGEEWVKIDGEKYMFADVYEDELTVGDEYTLYLDCFGRIYDWEIVAGSVKYAVLNKFIYSVSEDSYVATLYTDEGQEKTCVFDGDVVDENGDTITGTDAENYIIDAVYNDDYSRTDVLDRIIEYKISAAGELKKVQFVTPYVSSLYDDGSMETYSERNARIGGVKLSSNTKIINAAEYVDGNYDIGDLEVCTIKNLIDDEAYAAYAYGSKCSDGTYPFVVITMGNITGMQESDDEENDDAVPDDGETDTAEPERAIIDRFIYSDSAEGYKATLYTTDGVAKLYVFDGRVVDENNTEVYRNAEAEEYILNAVYQNGNAQNGKTSVVDRVVEYNINTETGKISTIKFLPVCIDSMDWQTGTFGSYDKNTSTIGSIKLDRSTVIFDAVIYVAEGYNSYSDLGIASADDLVEGTQYEAFAFGEASSDGAYPLVIVTSAVINYNAETSFAVVTGALTHTEDVYGNFVYGVPVLYEGEATDLWVSHDAEGDDVTSLNRGDVIFFMTNNEGYVDQIDVIFSFGDEPAYSDLTATLVEDNDMKIIDNGIVRYPVDDSGCMPPDFAKEWYTTQFDAIQLVFGPVMEKGDSYFTLGSIAYDDEYGLITNKYNDIRNGAGGCYEIDYTQDTNIYVYDYAQTRKDARLYAGGSIVATRFADAYNANGGDTILWDYVGDFGECVNKSSVNFAFAKVVDGEATDVFAFLAK